METFSALLELCVGIHGEFPAQRPVTQGFDVLLDLRLHQLLIEQWRRHRADYGVIVMKDFIHYFRGIGSMEAKSSTTFL